MQRKDGIETIRQFAIALDKEQFAAAATMLADACLYDTGEETLRGPQEIIATYRDHADRARATFDVVEYDSGPVRTDLAMTWAHVLFDGAGSERFIEQLAGPDDARRAELGILMPPPASHVIELGFSTVRSSGTPMPDVSAMTLLAAPCTKSYRAIGSSPPITGGGLSKFNGTVASPVWKRSSVTTK